MKFNKYIITLLALFSFITGAMAAPSAYSSYAAGGTALGATNSWAVIGGFSANNGTPLVTFLSSSCVAGDATNGYVQFYKSTNSTYATAATTNSLTNSVASTNGFVAGTVVVIRNLATDTYQRRMLTTSLSTQIVFTVAPSPALAVGDIIYQETLSGKIPYNQGQFTLSLTGPGIYSGQKGIPLLLEATGTNTPVLNAVNATFIP